MVSTIVISAIIAIILIAVIWNIIRNKKQGKGSCGCGCSDCAMSDICHKNN